MCHQAKLNHHIPALVYLFNSNLSIYCIGHRKYTSNINDFIPTKSIRCAFITIISIYLRESNSISWNIALYCITEVDVLTSNISFIHFKSEILSTKLAT
ncbi:hypothetical protein QL285_029342 [Trifolium repens]|nr:hypothetical protein QL285_029342 [Trifolium repens]